MARGGDKSDRRKVVRGQSHPHGPSALHAVVQSDSPRPSDHQESEDQSRPESHSGVYQRNVQYLKDQLGYKVSFDIIVREFNFGGRSATLVYIDSMVAQTDLTLLMHYFMDHDPTHETSVHRGEKPSHTHQKKQGSGGQEKDIYESLKKLIQSEMPYIEISQVKEMDQVLDQIMAGPAAVLVDGADGAIVMDVRKYPTRQPDDPTIERVIRGPRDGFVETLIFNTILIRRRIRDPRLRYEYFQVGSRSKSDVVMMYINDIANDHFIEEVRRRIKAIKIDALTMSEKALEEWVIKKPWWNPFPVSRFTQRPDVSAEHLLQGHVLLMIDTSPNAIIIPVSFFSFLQSAEEYHEGIVPGSYLKWVRTLGLLFSLIGPPLWYTLIEAHVKLGGGWAILLSPKTVSVPLFWQLIMAEMGVDLLRLALIFTPNSLSQSMGFFGAILLGDIAIKAKILDAEAMVYVAVAAVGTFASPDMEFGMALRMLRIVLLVLAAVFALVGLSWLGLALGLVGIVVLLATTDSFGMKYLWPLYPFNGAELFSTLSRRPLNHNTTRPSLTLPKDKRRSPR